MTREGGVAFHSTLDTFPRHSAIATPTGENVIMTRACRLFAPLMLVFLLTSLSVWAAEPQQPGTGQRSDEELVKETQNPVADLITVPLQNNFNFGTGSKNRTVYVGNIQPVIPIQIGDDWNLITRTIMPIINQPSLFPGTGSATGLGDINPTFFFTARQARRADLGCWADVHVAHRHRHPARHAANSVWAPRRWYSPCRDTWVFGALANNQWSVAGWGERQRKSRCSSSRS